MLFLTLAHSLARLVEVLLVASGTVIGFCPDPKKLVPYIGTFKPDARARRAPRFREDLQRGRAARSRGWQGQDLPLGSQAGDRILRGARRPRGARPWALRLRHTLAYRLVLGKIAATSSAAMRIGRSPARLRSAPGWATSTAASALTVLEGYGLTETNAASHVNRPRRAANRHSRPRAFRASRPRLPTTARS